MLFCHCSFIYGCFPLKMLFSASGADTKKKRYIDSFEDCLSKREKEMYTGISPPLLQGRSIYGHDHMWQTAEVKTCFKAAVGVTFVERSVTYRVLRQDVLFVMHPAAHTQHKGVKASTLVFSCDGMFPLSLPC